MREWALHTIVILCSAGIFQVAFLFAPPSWQFQLLVLTLSSNLIALGYAIFAYRKFELTSEKLQPVFTSRFLRIIDRSYGAMPSERKDQLERNMERLVAVGMVAIDKLGSMDEEEFGKIIGRVASPRFRVTPEEIRAKITMVGGE